MPTYSARVQKLLKRSAKFRKRLEGTLEKHDEHVDLVPLTELLDKVDQELIRLGRKRARKTR